MTLRFSIQGSLGLMLVACALTAYAQGPLTAPAQGPLTAPAQEPLTAPAQGPLTAPAQEPLTARAQEPAGPGLLELLEFIGEFTTDDGEWVDPEALLEMGNGAPVLAAEAGDETEVAGEESSEVPAENCIAARCE